MTLSNSQRAALRAKKAIANGDTSFTARGETHKAAFEALKETAQTTMGPLHKHIKIRGATSAHTSVPTRLLSFNPMNISDTSDEEEQADALSDKIKTHKETN